MPFCKRAAWKPCRKVRYEVTRDVSNPGDFVFVGRIKNHYPTKAMQFKEAIDQFSGWRKFKVKIQTVRGYDQTLRQFCLFLRNPEIEDININHVMDYLNGMKDMGWDQNSFVGKCMALRKFFEFYRLQGYAVINEELIPIMQAERKLPRVATIEEYKKLIGAIPEKTNDPRHIRNFALINLLWDTGARNGEILS